MVVKELKTPVQVPYPEYLQKYKNWKRLVVSLSRHDDIKIMDGFTDYGNAVQLHGSIWGRIKHRPFCLDWNGKLFRIKFKRLPAYFKRALHDYRKHDEIKLTY